MIKIALVNPNSSVEVTDRMVAIARQVTPVGTELVGLTAESGPELITNEEQLAEATRAVSALAPRLQVGFQAVVVGAFGDPGLIELRSAFDGPVVGIGETSLLEAARQGRRFGVVTTTPDLVRSIERVVSNLGLSALFGGVVLTNGNVVEVTAQYDRLLFELDAAIDRAVADMNLSVFVIGGGPLAEAARVLAGRKPVMVIEPVPVATRHAVAMLALQRSQRNARPC